MMIQTVINRDAFGLSSVDLPALQKVRQRGAALNDPWLYQQLQQGADVLQAALEREDTPAIHQAVKYLVVLANNREISTLHLPIVAESPAALVLENVLHELHLPLSFFRFEAEENRQTPSWRDSLLAMG